MPDQPAASEHGAILQVPAGSGCSMASGQAGTKIATSLQPDLHTWRNSWVCECGRYWLVASEVPGRAVVEAVPSRMAEKEVEANV